MKKYKRKLILLMDVVFITASIILIWQITLKHNLYQENINLNSTLQNQTHSQDYLDYIKRSVPKNNNLSKNRNLSKLKASNSDLLGWIYISDTLIDYPVLQSKDNSFYLNHSFEKKESFTGSIYMDFRNNSFKDQNTIIYGHSLNDGSMFSDLKKFKDETYALKNNNITIVTLDKVLIYEVFAVCEVDADYDYRTPNYNETKDFENFINRVSQKSVIKYKLSPKTSDKILTLSTCNSNIGSTRLSIHAVLKKSIQLD